jgi:ABC-type molybdate transport system substrate-binding protein
MSDLHCDSRGSAPFEKGPKIFYPIAAVAPTQRPDAARQLVTFLGSEADSAIFVAYGFLARGDAKP